jgi:hypothetical protein
MVNGEGAALMARGYSRMGKGVKRANGLDVAVDAARPVAFRANMQTFYKPEPLSVTPISSISGLGSKS